MGGTGKRGSSRSTSRESKRSYASKINDPMRESTVSFFKEAFGIKDRVGLPDDDLSELQEPGQDMLVASGAAAGLLKNRRTAGRKQFNNDDRNGAPPGHG